MGNEKLFRFYFCIYICVTLKDPSLTPHFSFMPVRKGSLIGGKNISQIYRCMFREIHLNWTMQSIDLHHTVSLFHTPATLNRRPAAHADSPVCACIFNENLSMCECAVVAACVRAWLGQMVWMRTWAWDVKPVPCACVFVMVTVAKRCLCVLIAKTFAIKPFGFTVSVCSHNHFFPHLFFYF